MLISEESLLHFSQVTHDIYQAARKMPVQIFQSWLMEHLQKIIRFDAAWWGRATCTTDSPSAPNIYGHYLFNLPDEFAQEWEAIKESDHFASRVTQTTSKTLISGIDDPEMSADLRRLLVEHKIARAICCVVEDPVIALNQSGALAEGRLIDFLSLYRNNPEDSFSSNEMIMLQCLAPHISEAINQCVKHYLEHQRQEQQGTDTEAMAIADNRGVLHAMEPIFRGLFCREWPEWQGVVVDQTLLPTPEQSTFFFLGQKISLTTERLGELVLVRLRLKSPVDDLSERELLVARMFSNGKTYKEIASDLHRSPSTIRNHIQSIYLKLGIKNKAELVNLLNTSPPET